MSLQTPSSERIHIGFFGCTNSGKSSLVNAFTSQSISLVSAVAGTTTDPVKKAMELLPMGPVMIVDTAGFDDEGELGVMRTERTKKVLDTIDIAVLVRDVQKGITETDKELEEILKDKKVPYIIAYNKADLVAQCDIKEENSLCVSALTGMNINMLRERVSRLSPDKSTKMRIVDSFVKKGDFVIMVTPIDEAAPKGRIILPQQQVLRNILDIGATAIVTQVEQLDSTIKNLAVPPDVVIVDSQVFGEVKGIVPDSIPLTSFSILLANYKGILEEAVSAVKKIDLLKDGDKILIAEGCTHHRQCNDIGSVKIPGWIRKHTGKEIQFEIASGTDFPDDLSPYSIVVHCGGCMITERDVLSRMEKAQNKNIPFTNYGILIAHMNGILKRSVEVFPKLYNELI